jgi:hypothetical protein
MLKRPRLPGLLTRGAKVKSEIGVSGLNKLDWRRRPKRTLGV